MTAALAIGIAGSHLTLLLYQLCDFGPAQYVVAQGIVGYYEARGLR